MIVKSLSIAALLTLGLSGTAFAQGNNTGNQQGGLVNVNVQDVSILTDFLNGTNVAVPVTVQAPINVAAEVCGVAVNVLARGGPSNSTCDAVQGSQALADLVLAQQQ
jgi:hypothetical protein